VKFFGGFLVGLVTGPLLLIYSIALVIAGAFLGWKFFGEAPDESDDSLEWEIFGEESDEPSAPENQTEQETE
jgi:hypothetical protein